MTDEAPKRSMSKARRLRIYLLCRGRCVCGVKVPMEKTTIDHRIPLWISHDDSDDNLRYLCRACDAPKTAGDLHVIAHIKRIHRKSDPDTRKPPRMRSAPFQRGLTKGFDGVVRPRKAVGGSSPKAPDASQAMSTPKNPSGFNPL